MNHPQHELVFGDPTPLLDEGRQPAPHRGWTGGGRGMTIIAICVGTLGNSGVPSILSRPWTEMSARLLK